MTHPPISIPVNPFKNNSSVVNPFKTQEIGFDSATENPEDDGDILTKVANIGKYAYDYARQVVTNPISTLSTFANPVTPFKTGQAISDRLQVAHEKLMDGSVVEGLKEGLKNADFSPSGLISSAASGIPNFFASAINDAAETITGFKNDNGTARPATPQELAGSTLSTIGNLAFAEIAGGINKAILPNISKIGTSELLAQSQKSSLSTLGKTLASETLGISTGAMAQNLIANPDQDNVIGKSIAQGLAMAPLGVLLSPFKLSGLNKEISNQQNILAARALQITSNDPIPEVFAKVSAVASGDDLLSAAIKARINTKNGIIVPNVSQEGFDDLNNNSSSGGVNYDLHPILKTAGVTYKGVDLDFQNALDRVTYHLTKATKTKNYQLYLDDAMNQSGLSEVDLLNHGKQVRAEIKNLFDSGGVRDKTALELAKEQEDIVNRGREIISNTADGASIKTAQGKTWKRVGDNFTDGEITLPSNSQDLPRILGLQFKNLNPSSNVLDVPSQKFERFNNKGINPDQAFYYYHPDSQTLLASGVELSDRAKVRFESTGFLPNEVVTYSGQEFRVKDVSNGNASIYRGSISKQVPISDLVRPNKGLNTENLKNGTQKIGVLTPDSFFDNLFNNFVAAQVEPQIKYGKGLDNLQNKLNKNPTSTKIQDKLEAYLKQDPSDSFDKSLSSFLDQSGLDPKDKAFISNEFSKRLRIEVTKRLDPKDKLGIDQVQAKFSEILDKHNEDFRSRLFNQIKSAGITLDNAGSGKYHLYDSDGSLLSTVGNLSEVTDYLKSIGQSKLIDLDGASTGAIPTTVANIGIQSQWSPGLNTWEESADKLFTGKISSNITPSMNLFQRLDGRLGTTILTDFGNKMREAQILKRNYISSKLEPLMNSYKQTSDLFKSFSSSRHELLASALETMSRDEIRNSFLGRAMNPAELSFSERLVKDLNSSNKTVSQFADLISNLRRAAGEKIKYGTPEWANLVTSIGVADPKILSLIDDFMKGTQIDQSKFSTYAVLRDASATMYPDQALSREEFFRRNNFSDKEIKYISESSKLLESSAKLFNINTLSPLTTFLPIARERFAASDIVGDPLYNFVKEFRRSFGEQGLDEPSRNPQNLIYRYLYAGSNTYSGFNDLVSKTHSGVVKDLGQLRLQNPALENLVDVSLDKVGNHVSVVRGVPDISSKLSGSLTGIGKILGMNVTDALTSLMYSAYLGGVRWYLLVRDLNSTMRFSYTNFSGKFAEKVISTVASPNTGDYIKALEDRGVLPKARSEDFVTPDSEDYISGNNSVVSKVSRTAFHLSGQEQLYRRSAAGVYKATRELVDKNLQDLNRNKISKVEAYENIHLSLHGRSFSQIFDGLVSSGHLDDAADLLGKNNIKLLINEFGLNNNPVGWNRPIGRVLGALNSWNVNAIQTGTKMITQGTRMERSARLLRYAAYQGAVVAIGSSLGLQLNDWMDDPLSLWPKIKGLASWAGDEASISSHGITEGDPLKVLHFLIPDPENNDIARPYIPYSLNAKEILNSMDSGNPAEAFGFHFQK